MEAGGHGKLSSKTPASMGACFCHGCVLGVIARQGEPCKFDRVLIKNPTGPDSGDTLDVRQHLLLRIPTNVDSWRMMCRLAAEVWINLSDLGSFGSALTTDACDGS